MNDISDSELIMLWREENEDAKEMLYNRYIKIIKGELKKYHKIFKKIKIDELEMYNYSLSLLNMAVLKYDQMSSASFYTFYLLILRRNIKKEIIKYSNMMKKYEDEITIDYESSEYYQIYDKYINGLENDPLEIISKKEEEKNLLARFKEILSKREYIIFMMFINGLNYQEIGKKLNISYKQIANAKERIKKKVRLENSIEY